MTHERLTKPSLDIPPARASSHDEDPAASTVTPSSVDKMLASISHDSVIGGLGTTAEAGPTPGAQISRADQAALDATRPALVLWTQRITQATRQIEDAAKNPDRAAASLRVVGIIDQLKNDAAFELLGTLVLRLRVDLSTIASELGDAAHAIQTFNIAVFSFDPRPVDPRLDSEPVVTQMNRLAKHFGYNGWWNIPQQSPLQGPSAPEVNFARPILESAIADAAQMESRIGLPGMTLEYRRREWIDTLNALVSTIPQLSPSDRVSLRPRFRLLQSIFDRLVERDKRLPDHGFGYDNQKPQMIELAKALLP